MEAWLCDPCNRERSPSNVTVNVAWSQNMDLPVASVIVKLTAHVRKFAEVVEGDVPRLKIDELTD